MPRPCPNCGNSQFAEAVSELGIRRQTLLRQTFIERRAPHTLSPAERKDLTDFAHNEIVPLLACASCGLLQRADRATPAVEQYVKDEYDPEAIDRVYPRYVAGFRAKQKDYRGLLNPAANVLEVGSHFGAFLEVAREWGWSALGIDVGEDSTRYAKSKGHNVIRASIEECDFPNDSFDAVFIWNCFEQLPDPHQVLRHARSVLRPGAFLVVRTPNALFYLLSLELLAHANTNHSHTEQLVFRALAYNNLLAFPYLYGYNSRNLCDLVQAHSFECIGGVNSELITVPLPATPEWVAQEEQEVSATLRDVSERLLEQHPGLLAAPWIELKFRKS